MNNKKIKKRRPKGPQGAPLPFKKKVIIVVLTDIMAILLTPGINLIQSFNTNMYLNHFYVKKILKCIFPKVTFLKFKFILLIHYKSQYDEINYVGISKDITIECNRQIFKKQKFKYINFKI